MALHSAEKRLTIPLFGNEDLARAIAAAGNYQLGSLETRNFTDGESYLRFLDDVEGRDVDLIYTRHIPIITSYRDFAADAAREFKDRSVNLAPPLSGLLRQDKRFKSGDVIIE